MNNDWYCISGASTLAKEFRNHDYPGVSITTGNSRADRSWSVVVLSNPTEFLLSGLSFSEAELLVKTRFPTAMQRYWVVIRIDNSVIKNAAKLFKHGDFRSAKTESTRLQKLFPNSKFVIMALVHAGVNGNNIAIKF